MDNYELNVTLAMAQIAELRRQADQQRLASRLPGRTAGGAQGSGARVAAPPGADPPDR